GGPGDHTRRRPPDTDDHHIGRVLPAALGEHRAHATGARIAVQRAHALVATDAYAVARVLGLVERGYLGTRHAAHDASGHLEHGDLHAPLAGGRRHLQADIAAADADDPTAWGAFGADAVGIGDGAQVVHARKLAAGSEQPTRTAAGRE